MKKFAIYAFALLATATTLTSCGDDEETTVTPTAPAVNTFSAKLLGAQDDPKPSFLATSTGNVYGAADSASFTANNVNVSFALIGTSAPLIPKFVSLNERRNQGLRKQTTNSTATYFRESSLSQAEFMSDTIGRYITRMTTSTLNRSLAVETKNGKVYEVITGSTKALMYVSALSAPSSQTTTEAKGTVTVDVKVLK
jgi:hypothetical protein